MPTRIQDAVKGTPICDVVKAVEPIKVEAFIAFVLGKEVVDMWNGDQRLNLQPHQIPTIARMLMETFKGENLADFTLCFRRGVMGFYNDDRDKLLRIDGAVLTGWMRKYLEEKYQVIEDELMKTKDSPFTTAPKPHRESDKINPDRNLLSLLKTVIGDVNAPEENNAEENAYQRYKTTEPRATLTEAHYRKILKQEYPEATDEQINEAIKSIKK